MRDRLAELFRLRWRLLASGVAGLVAAVLYWSDGSELSPFHRFLWSHRSLRNFMVLLLLPAGLAGTIASGNCHNEDHTVGTRAAFVEGAVVSWVTWGLAGRLTRRRRRREEQEAGRAGTLAATGVEGTTEQPLDMEQEMRHLVDDYRSRCLWFLRPDFYPSNDEERLQTLGHIERYGDRAALQRAGKVRRWLSKTSERAASS